MCERVFDALRSFTISYFYFVSFNRSMNETFDLNQVRRSTYSRFRQQLVIDNK